MTTTELTTSDAATETVAARRRTAGAARGLLLLAAIVLSTLTLIGPSNTAGAYAWNPTVTLQGSARCNFTKTTWVWVEGSNGERGWATNGTGGYRFTFKRVPTSGMTVRVNFGQRNSNCTAKFGLNRPTVGTSATRNVSGLG